MTMTLSCSSARHHPQERGSSRTGSTDYFWILRSTDPPTIITKWWPPSKLLTTWVIQTQNSNLRWGSPQNYLKYKRKTIYKSHQTNPLIIGPPNVENYQLGKSFKDAAVLISTLVKVVRRVVCKHCRHSSAINQSLLTLIIKLSPSATSNVREPRMMSQNKPILRNLPQTKSCWTICSRRRPKLSIEFPIDNTVNVNVSH